MFWKKRGPPMSMVGVSVWRGAWRHSCALQALLSTLILTIFSPHTVWDPPVPPPPGPPATWTPGEPPTGLPVLYGSWSRPCSALASPAPVRLGQGGAHLSGPPTWAGKGGSKSSMSSGLRKPSFSPRWVPPPGHQISTAPWGPFSGPPQNPSPDGYCAWPSSGPPFPAG